MLKKTVTYADYNGNTRTDDLYFNLSKTETVELELSYEGGLEAKVKELSENQDRKGMYELFKHLVILSYGIKSEDGRSFVKSKEIADAFVQTEAYDQLMYELLSSADTAASFFNGVIPQF